MKRRIISLKPWIFWLIYAAVIAACIVIDQLTKHFIEIAVRENGGRIKIIGDWLTLVWTTNGGASFGIFENLEWRHIMFFVMTVVGLPIFGYMLYRARTRSVWGQVAFAFIIGGTIGNAIDRLFLAEKGFFTGEVRDFVQVEHFPGIFNMADSFLVVGVILALLAIVFFDPDSLLSVFTDERKVKQTAQTAQSQQKDIVQSVVTEERSNELQSNKQATERDDEIDTDSK